MENNDLIRDFVISTITMDDVLAVYKQLKDRYDLVLTTTLALNDGFTIDCPVIVGKAHEQIMYLYACEGDFIFDIQNAEQTAGTHGHPLNIEQAIEIITEFMEGKSDYILRPFNQA